MIGLVYIQIQCNPNLSMKKITCAAMGGPETCHEVIVGSTSEEMVGNGWKHIEAAHHDLAENIKGNTKEVNDAWMGEFAAKFDGLEEV